MSKYTLENYEPALRRQVVHMDQALCYCPEFRATHMMNQYPSRRLQLARAIWLDEIAISDYAGEVNFKGILSRQGERWQNFGENPEDCTDATILSRAMLLAKGYDSPEVKAFKAARTGACNAKKWDLPHFPESKMAIFVDSDTDKIDGAEAAFKAYCDANGIAFANDATIGCLGFGYFAHGLVEEGTDKVKAVVEAYNAMGVEKVMVLSAKSAYMFRTFAKKLDIDVKFEVVYLPEILAPITVEKRTYVYAGSFNLRYLCNSEMINELIPSEDDNQIPACAEFTPILEGKTRANRLTIWQKPVAAEYTMYAADEKMLEAIKADAVHDIKEAKPEQIVVFEPTAYKILKEALPEVEIKYYLDLI